MAIRAREDAWSKPRRRRAEIPTVREASGKDRRRVVRRGTPRLAGSVTSPSAQGAGSCRTAFRDARAMLAIRDVAVWRHAFVRILAVREPETERRGLDLTRGASLG